MVSHSSLSSEITARGFAVIPLEIDPPLLAGAVRKISDKLGIDLRDPVSFSSLALESNGFAPLWNAQILWRIRALPSLWEVFTHLWGTEDLWVTIDRCHFKPPASVHPGLGLKHFLHWDADMSHGDFINYQGVLALTDTGANQGNFVCSSDLYRTFVTAGREEAGRRRDSGMFDTVHVSCPAGSLIVWDYRLLHGNAVNLSSSPRIAMYVSMKPAGDRDSLASRTEAWRTGVWPHGPSKYPGFSNGDESAPDLSSFWCPSLGIDRRAIT